MHGVRRLVGKILSHSGVRYEDFVYIEAVVARVLIFLLHHTDDGVWNVGKVDGLADRGTAWEQLLANVSADECDVAGLRQILIVVEAALAYVDGADFGKGRRRTRNG